LNAESKLLSLNVWESEEAVEKWRNELNHRMSQLEGREKLFESYRITVASVIREYDDCYRNEAPVDSNEYFRHKLGNGRL
jgi:heme-degrading monooxygenase HmoA